MSYAYGYVALFAGLGAVLGLLATVMLTDKRAISASRTICSSFRRIQRKRRNRKLGLLLGGANEPPVGIPRVSASRRPDMNALAIAEDLAKVLKQRSRSRIAGVYLFGSRARGDYQFESDIDIAIVLSPGTRPGWGIRLVLLYFTYLAILRKGMYTQIRILHEDDQRKSLYVPILESEGVNVWGRGDLRHRETTAGQYSRAAPKVETKWKFMV